MATYYLKQKNSDLPPPGTGSGFNKEISAETENAGSITVPVANSNSEFSQAYTKLYKPNNADWETGGITVKVRVTTANSNIHLKVQAERVNSAGGGTGDQSAETAEQTLSATGVYTFSIASKNWSAGNCGDRLRIVYWFRSSQAHGTAASVVIETGTTDTEVTPANLTKNAGTCRAAFVKNLRQYKNDHKTFIAEGGNTDGAGTSNQT